MKKRSKPRTKKTQHITQSVPFYIISIFFAQFIHTHIIKDPTLVHAIFALLSSFCLSLCLIHALKFISKEIVNFHVNAMEKIKLERERYKLPNRQYKQENLYAASCKHTPHLNQIIYNQKKEIQSLKDMKKHADQTIEELKKDLKEKKKIAELQNVKGYADQKINELKDEQNDR
jgi:hypothetical protein